MEPRIQNPAQTVPGALDALLSFARVIDDAAAKAGIPSSTVDLVEHPRQPDQRSTAAPCASTCTPAPPRSTGSPTNSSTRWQPGRNSPYFDEAQRAALALVEAGTRLPDRFDAVSDDVWAMATEQFDEPALTALVLVTGLINNFNRLNVMTGQVAGEWTAQYTA